MATVDEVKAQLPSGFRIVEDEDYKVKASAANDLVKLKNEMKKVLGDISLDEVGSIISEHSKIKKSQQISNEEEMTKLQKKLDKIIGERETLSNELKKSKLQVLLRQRIDSIGGKKLSEKFINFDELFGIDIEGGESEKIVQQIDGVLKNGYEEQNKFIKEYGGTQIADMPINFNVGGGRGKLDQRQPEEIEKLNRKLAEIANSFGAQFVGVRKPDSQKK